LKDIYGKAKTNVVLAKKVKQLIQYWRVETKGDGIYRFVNCASGYYLAVKGTVKSQANVYVAKNGSIDWKLKKYDDGTFSLRPANGKKVYLSVAGGAASKGANIRLWGAVSNNGQKFMIVKSKRLTGVFAKGQTVAPGIVKVKAKGSKTPIYVANSSTSNNNNLKTAAASDALSQVYQLRYRGNGLYEFQNAHSYKVPTIYKYSKKAGAKVVQYKRMLGLNQLWYFKPVDGGYQLLSARSGLAIDIAGGKTVTGKVLQMAKPSKANTQKFTFEKTQLVANGTYVFQSAMAMPLVLNVHGNSKEDGANVELNRSAGATGEKFKVRYLKNGNYRITNATTKKCIEVAGASKKNGANIQMSAKTGDANQQWIIEVGDTGLMFKSALSGKYLNVNSSQAKSKANIDQRTASETANQCWTLASSDWKYYAGASSAAMKLIKKAETYEGWRYQWGGRDPSTSFDCAGLVMYCSNKAWGTHFDLMNTNAEMLYEMCTHISAKDAKPGDLVFYRGTYGNDITYISHVVIFTGKGYMYGAGDPIGYAKVNAVKNFKGKTATAVYARIRH
ncbi:MAG: RICIN domain-containing protein, partial [Coriobacteriia bacterium]|nr:RICIN domain-containing protein [Coriobacteriia bacterium]